MFLTVFRIYCTDQKKKNKAELNNCSTAQQYIRVRFQECKFFSEYEKQEI